MKISKKSWHYRLLRGSQTLGSLMRMVFGEWLTKDILDLPYSPPSEDWGPPHNLCSYFWQVVLSIGLLIPFSFVVMAVALIICSIAMVVLGTIRLVRFVYGKIKSEPKESPGSEHPGLLSSWLRAKKDKVCPLLEFED